MRRGLTLIAGGEPASAKRWSSLVPGVVDIYVQNRCTMIYCGMGTGLAGAIAKGVLTRQGVVKAVVIKGKKPPGLPSRARQVVVSSYYERMRRLLATPFGVLVLPGGIGTLAEFTSAAALSGIRLIRAPVVVLDPEGWFDPIAHYCEKALRLKMARSHSSRMWTVIDSPQDAIPTLMIEALR
jgi:predicted Rossmann-fold nucleotide-binding protein